MGKKRGLVEAEEAAAVPPHHQQQHPCDDKVKGDTNIKRQEAKDAGELKKKKKIKKLKLKATTTSEADPPVTATQAVAEIDDLFAGLSRHKQTVAAAAAAAAAAEIKKKKKEQELKQKNSEREAREGREGQRYDPKRDDPDVRPYTGKVEATTMAAARSLTCLVLSSASCLLVLLSLLLPQSTVTFFLLPNGHSTISISSTRIRAQTRSVVATSSPSSPLFSSSSFSSSTCFPQMMRKQQQHDDLAEEQQLQQKSGVLPRLGRIVKMTIFPSIVTALGMAVQPAHAYRDMRMSPETRIVAAILGRFIIPIGLCLYFAVNRKRMAREEATRVKAALDKEQQKKEAYLAEMKEQGFNLGSVGGSLTKEEEDMISRVEEGTQLMVTEKAAWVKLLQRAQYSRDVVDGKAQPNAEIAIMTKKELKRVVNANKTVKAAGFKSE